jgi:branched-chain amino acid aminotransferase
VRENGLKEAYLRPLAYLGSEAMGLRAEGLKTHVVVAAWEWPSYMDPEARERGIKVRTSSYTRHHVNITLCKAKAVGNYTNSMLALREAIESGAESAAARQRGYVAEGSGENSSWCAAARSTRRSSLLPRGITRDTIIRSARDMGLEPAERRITRRGLLSPTRPSSPAPPPKSSRSAKSTPAA